MQTMNKYLAELVEQKAQLEENISDKGIKTNTDDTFNDLIPKVNEVYNAGLQSGKELLEKYFTYDGLRKDYQVAFTEQSWSDYEFTFTPKYPCYTENVYKMFFNYQGKYLPKGLKGRVIHSYDGYKITSGSQCGYVFAYCYKLKEIYDIGLPILKSLSHFAYKSPLIEQIEIVRVAEDTTFNNSFNGCTALKEVRFEGVIGQNGLSFVDSPDLSVESMLNVIDCLADYSADTSGTEWTVIFNSVNLAKLTEEQKAKAASKGWTLK